MIYDQRLTGVDCLPCQPATSRIKGDVIPGPGYIHSGAIQEIYVPRNWDHHYSVWRGNVADTWGTRFDYVKFVGEWIELKWQRNPLDVDVTCAVVPHK